MLHNRTASSIVAIGAVIFALAAGAPLMASVKLASIFSDNMVLQREMPIPVWGWADPGEKVKVTFAGRSQMVAADAHGNWMIKLPAMKADTVGRDLVVRGNNRIVIHNVLVGEVWLCSGQSNMVYPVRGWKRGSTPPKEITSAHYPLIRLLDVGRCIAARPKKTFKGRWVVCSPRTVPTFSAVAYYFGRDLFKKLHVPIGLITSAWSGTTIQPWTPDSGFEDSPPLSTELHQYLADRSQQRQRLIQTADEISVWLKQVRKAQAANNVIPRLHLHWRSIESYRPQENPTVLFNGMIAPLIPYALRGVIWYQGENNHGDPLYYDRLKSLISSWRTHWNEGDFPFYMVQIAPFDYHSHVSPPFVWAAEQGVVRSIPNTGIVGTMDLGMLHNIHPFDKWDMGRRLTLWALAKTYDKHNLVYSGPIYKSMQIKGNTVIVHFDHTGTGLKTRNGKPLDCFKIAGRDGKYVPARATIAGHTVVVSAKNVSVPTAVEFAWNYHAQPNLENKAGLPALPFVTNVMGDVK